MKKLLCILSIACIATACGKRGPLVPPEALVPAPIADLRIEQKGDRFFVSWSRPAQEEGGRAMKDLAGFRVFRREVLPPGEDCEECPGAYRLVASVDLDYPKEIVIAGDRYVLTDGDVAAGKTYRYKVVSYKRDGTLSRASNRADRRRLLPPRPPVVKVLSTPSGVELQWQSAEGPDTGRIEGYNVYRRRTDQNFSSIPLNGTPLHETVFEDRRLEHRARYVYAVRTVAVIEGGHVESELSNEVVGELTEPE